MFNLLKAQQNNPVADNKAIVISGDAGFTVITSQLIRMEYTEKGIFEEKGAVVIIDRKSVG